MAFERELTYLRAAVQDELGDVASLVDTELIDRWINQGQRRMEPDVLLPSTADVSVAVGDTTYSLPSDLVQINEFQSDAATSCAFPSYTQHGYSARFRCTVTSAWTGTLLYQAHYPAITDVAAAQVPVGAADGLISYALYKAFRRFAANRAEYRKFATIVGNGVTMGDLEATAEAHLQDFADSVAASSAPAQATTFYE